MESSSETTTPSTAREEDATGDPPPPASPPPPLPPAPAPPPAHVSTSSKRRWSPCTWRYAIEESQAELPSRSRSTVAVNAGSASLRSAAFPPSQQQQTMKAKPSPHHQGLSHPKPAEDTYRSSNPPASRAPYPADCRMPASLPHTSSKSRTTELSMKASRHHSLSAKGRDSEKEEEEEDDDAEQDQHEHDACHRRDSDDSGAAGFDKAYFKRRRREMSPSELYFCPVCSVAKGTIISAHKQES